MPVKDYDFAGWVTKNDIRCLDGVTIKQDAFKHNHDGKVPLVWNHDSNSVTNILGHIILHNQPDGVYGYGYFNDTDEAENAREMIKHGDIQALSIGANKLKRNGSDILHGNIYEVSLVLAGANPGAHIEEVITHSGDTDETAGIIYTGFLIHSAGDEPPKNEGGNNMDGETIGDVLDTLTPEQMDAVEALVAGLLPEDEGVEQAAPTTTTTTTVLEQNDKGGEEMKHNVFDGNAKGDILEHSADTIQAVFAEVNNGSATLKEASLKHGITNIESLFPEAKIVGEAPRLYKDQNTAGAAIVDACHKSPFAKVKTMIADLTDDQARARGYIKGNEKIEQIFDILHREVTPQTIYKKQGIDRDDVIDITDFNIVSFMNNEMRMMLIEEIGRALLVGDGRSVSDRSKIKEKHIVPVINDDDLYTIKTSFTTPASVIETVIKIMAEYQGSGTPAMYINQNLLADIKLLKADDGRYLFGDIPSTEAIATRLGVSKIVPTSFLKNPEFVIVNLSDYTLGANKGGEITNFDDFDIDFNKYKYLIETRLSGALTLPKSAIYAKSTTMATTTTSTTTSTTTTTTTRNS